MKFAFIFALLTTIGVVSKLPRLAAETSLKFQTNCSSFFHNPQMPISSETTYEIVNAYMCGVDLPEGPTKLIFIQTSVYHLIVVSGSHLSLLLLVLEMLSPSIPWLIQLFCCLMLALFTGLQPPILRAFFCLLATFLSNGFRLHWSPLLRLIFGSFICLSVFPQWAFSLSFLLSFGATLSLVIGKKFSRSKKPSSERLELSLSSALFSGVLTYLCLVPLLWGWGQLHPFGILTNIFIVPPLSLLLWFFCGLWIIWPTGSAVGINYSITVLQEIANFMPLTQLPGKLLHELLWIYILIVIFVLWTLQLNEARKPSWTPEK